MKKNSNQRVFSHYFLIISTKSICHSINRKISQDYILDGCRTTLGNCDFNDNIDLITNVRPVNKPQALGVPDMVMDVLTTSTDTLAKYFDKGYPGNKLVFSEVLLGGSSTPEWMNVDSLTGILTANPTIGAADDTFQVVVSATDYNLMVVRDTFNVIVNPTLINCTVDANPLDSNYVLDCATTEITFGGSSSTGKYYWTGPQGFTSIVANPTITLPGEYILSDTTTANNCPITSSLVVAYGTADPSVTINSSKSAFDCSVETIDLSASSDTPGATYIWLNTSGDTIGTQPVLTAMDPGNYRVMVSNSLGVQPRRP